VGVVKLEGGTEEGSLYLEDGAQAVGEEVEFGSSRIVKEGEMDGEQFRPSNGVGLIEASDIEAVGGVGRSMEDPCTQHWGGGLFGAVGVCKRGGVPAGEEGG
jgi:hypothetical protein